MARSSEGARNLAQVHAAISDYHENQQEIEAELAEDDGWEREHERGRAGHPAEERHLS